MLLELCPTQVRISNILNSQCMPVSGKNNQKENFPVLGMSCAGCAASVELILKALPGVLDAQVNFANETVWVEFEPREITTEGLKKALEDAGYGLIIAQEGDPGLGERLQQEEYKQLKRKTTGAVLLALPVFVIGMFFMHMPYGNWIMLAFSLPVILFFGRDFYRVAWKQLKHGRSNMDTLVAVSTGVAFLFSLFNTIWPEYWTKRGLEAHVYYEAATVIIALILLGRLLEFRAKANTARSIRTLMGLQAKYVVKVMADGGEVEVPVEEVNVGDVLAVKPGNRVPIDGVVTKGSSFVDESMITGEPIPVEKLEGDPVYAGTINQKGSFRLRTEKVESDTLLAHIIRLVREAQGSKAPVQHLVDRIAAIFVPVVIGLSLLTFVLWMALGGEGAFSQALLTAVTVLVIACPCALGLATPTAIIVGIGKGAENQILIKDAESLEQLYKVNVMVLDKTGTLTEGRPVVSDMVWESGADHSVEGAILLAMERQSEHPLAEAVVQRMSEEPLPEQEITGFEALPGQGIVAKVQGECYMVGNRRLLESEGITVSPEVEAGVALWEEAGKTILFFAGKGKIWARIAVTDQVKARSREAVEHLHAAGIETCMLTGDNPQTAKAVAERVGIRNYRAGLMPADKADFIRELQHAGKVVAMVGDGINDSQALAQADVSIAMGKGSDIAIDVAKVTLLSADLTVLLKALALSRQTVQAIRQNLFWAFIYNLIGIPLAAGIFYPINGFLLNPMIAAAAMAFSSVSVVTNSLRIRRKSLSYKTKK